MSAVHSVAVVSDVHGNARALQAVIAELERETPDAVVVAGDITAGPFPAETLALLSRLPQAHYVRGNLDREVVTAFDARRRSDPAFDPQRDDFVRQDAAWTAERINHAHRDFLDGFEEHVVLEVDGLGEVLFCHASPRSDTETITSLTPDHDLAAILTDVSQPIVVCGHTHVQFDRTTAGTRVLNAGSVGMPYEGRAAAYWLRLGPAIEFRSTTYEYKLAAEEILASDYWAADFLANTVLLNPPSKRNAEAELETRAARLRGQSPEGS